MSTAATKRRVGVISTVVVALLASLLVWMATRSEGEIVRKADLNDGGIWVTNAEQARFGRINKPAGQLDAGVLSDGSTGSGLDVFQDGAADRRLLQGEQPDRPDQPGRGHPRSRAVGRRAEAEHGHRQPRLHRPPRRRARRDHRHDRPGEGRACARSASTTARGSPASTASRPRPSRSPRSAATPPSPSGSTARCMPCPPSWARSPCCGPRATCSPRRSRRSSASRRSRRRSRRSAPTGSSGTPAPASSTPTRSRSPSSSRSGTPSPATRPSPRCSSPAPTRRRSSSRTRPS